jgi:hypothetical protein
VAKCDHQLIKDLFDIVGAIQASKRQSVADQVLRIQAFIGSTDDLFVDRRSLNWAPGGKARTTVETKPKKLSCQVTWRGGSSIVCTAEDAAKIVGKTPGSLAVYLSRGKGSYHCVIDDEVISVQRL